MVVNFFPEYRISEHRLAHLNGVVAADAEEPVVPGVHYDREERGTMSCQGGDWFAVCTVYSAKEVLCFLKMP